MLIVILGISLHRGLLYQGSAVLDSPSKLPCTFGCEKKENCHISSVTYALIISTHPSSKVWKSLGELQKSSRKLWYSLENIRIIFGYHKKCLQIFGIPSKMSRWTSVNLQQVFRNVQMNFSLL